VAGIVDGGFADAKWAVEQVYGRAQARTGVRAHVRGRCSIRARPRAPPRGGSASCNPSLLEGSWGAFELDLDALAARAPEAAEFNEVSPFPEVRQDLAFVVGDDIPASSGRSGDPRSGRAGDLRDVTVFDEYRGAPDRAGRRSLAFRLAFGSSERTLTDEDVSPWRAAIVAALAEQFGAELRG